MLQHLARSREAVPREEVHNRLRSVDRRAPSNTHERVRARGAQGVGPGADASDGRVLPDLEEGACVGGAGVQDGFDGLYDVGLGNMKGRKGCERMGDGRERGRAEGGTLV